MRQHIFAALLGLVASPLTQAHQPDGAGTFSNPVARVLPRFRYWLPDASVDADVLAGDIASAASIGAGGLEFVPFYEYGGELGRMPKGANWSIYNFGTPAFNHLFKKALEVHDEHGLVMDFALGPNQGQGVPAEPDDEGLQWDLVPATVDVPRSGSFSGKAPGWGTGNLVALVSALVKSNRTITYEASGLAGAQNVTYDEYQLKSGTLTEQTQHIDKRGFVKLSLPKAPKGSHYRLFAFHEKLTGHKNLAFESPKHATIFDDGSYAVDHFSAKGAAVVRKFWKQHILKDGIPNLLSKVGNYAWEDSIELTSNVSWSRSLPDLFKKTAGYSVKPYLPLLAFEQNTVGLQATDPGSFKCILDTEDEGIGYINDFRATLVEGYKQYLSAMTAWVHEELGVDLSVQPAYGSAMDALATVTLVDAPECESLSFKDNIDSYRSFTGPARLTGKRVISNEMGAVRGAGLMYHLPALLFSVNRAFLGGINQNVLHGQSYSGKYYNTTWPGHVPFRYLFSEPWSPHLPAWSHGLQSTLNYMGRMQHVLQTSIAKADVAIYNKESATTIRTIYGAQDLLSEGWSWNYLTADNVKLSQAHVKNGVLAPEGPAWKAFIVEASQNVTLSTIDALESFAQNGLPVILSGGLPKYYATKDGADKTKFERQLSNLLRTKNVYRVRSGKVAEKLRSLGLRPQIAVSGNGTCYTSWSEIDGVSYAVLYSDLTASSGEITVATTEIPYFLNPWTGETLPVLVYKRTKVATIIPYTLAGNQTMLLAFGQKMQKTTQAPRYHIEKAPSHVLGSRLTEDGATSLHVSRSGAASKAILSDGRSVNLDADSVPSTFQLSEWSLTAEHWEAPEDLYDSEHTVKYNTTHQLDTPISWSEIPALANASGIGYYTTTFQWPPRGSRLGAKSLGAYLSFSRVVDAVTVTVNGRRTPALDITDAVIDISPYLQSGQNKVQVIVPTTMWNYLRTSLDDLFTAGSKPLPITLQQLGAPLEGPAEAGLVGEVSIIPYKTVVI